MFEQHIQKGWQVEHADYWLTQANPFEIPRHDVTYAVRFYGHLERWVDERGHERTNWKGGEVLQAMAYDNPIPGFDTFNCINLRLWKAVPSSEFDFHAFNSAEYLNAVHQRQRAEDISACLYPNDNTDKGKELRLRQQYFFCSASLQDVIRRFKKKPGRQWDAASRRSPGVSGMSCQKRW